MKYFSCNSYFLIIYGIFFILPIDFFDVSVYNYGRAQIQERR